MSKTSLRSVRTEARQRADRLIEQSRFQRSDLNKSVADFAQLSVQPEVARAHTPAEWPERREELVRHYKGSVFIAIGAIARKIAMQEVKVLRRRTEKSGEKLEPVSRSHPLVQLFEKVNPLDTQWDLWFYMVGWRLLTGDCFLWKVRNGFGTPVELWPIPSQWVKAVPSPTQFIKGYEIHSFFGDNRPVLLPEDVVHIKQPTFDWEGSRRFYGEATIKAAATSIDLENEMFDRQRFMFSNWASPGMVFSSDQRLTEAQVRQVHAQMANQHRMSEHTGLPMITHSGLTLQRDSAMSNRELDYRNSLDGALSYTLAVHGVPKGVVGLVADQNRANLQAALTAFCEDTVNPILRHHSQHLTQDLAHDFEPDLVIQHGPCVVEDMEGLRKMMETAGKLGAVTPNEIREALMQRKPFKAGGNRPVVQAGMVEAPFGNAAPNDPPAMQDERTQGPDADTPSANGTQPGQAPSPPIHPGSVAGRSRLSNGHTFNGRNRLRGFGKRHIPNADAVAHEWASRLERNLESFTESLQGALQRQKQDVLERYRTLAGIAKSNGLGNGQGNGHGPVALAKAPVNIRVYELLPGGTNDRLLFEVSRPHLLDAIENGAQIEFGQFFDLEAEIERENLLDFNLQQSMEDFVDRNYNMDFWREIVNEQTRQALNDLTNESIREGLTGAETAQRILDDDNHIFDRVRAGRIARTERGAGLNAGIFTARNRLINEEMVAGEQWLALVDDETRHTHIIAHKQTVTREGGRWVVRDGEGNRIGEGRTFIIGRARARFPLDPTLPPQERIHCRCTTVSVPA